MSKCPSCGHPDAYVGLNDIECRRPLCKYWKPPTQEQLKEVILSEPRMADSKRAKEILIKWTFQFLESPVRMMVYKPAEYIKLDFIVSNEGITWEPPTKHR